jgi:hypothetical protein
MEMITLVNWKTVLSIVYIAKMQILVIIAGKMYYFLIKLEMEF